jgi:hypothetical protein
MMIIYLSLLVNIVVAGFWGIVLFRNVYPELTRPFGLDTPARRILACVYTAIAVVSVVAVVYESVLIPVVTVLFPVQIGYKLLTVLAVQDIKNPIVISNVLIAVLHGISLYMLFGFM